MGLLGSIRNFFGAPSYHVLEGAPALTDAQERGLALGAVYAVEGQLPVNALTMEADQRTARKLAKGSWGTEDHASALETYRFLLDGGHQRVYALVLPYLEEYLALVRGGGRADLKAVQRKAADELPGLAAAQGLDPQGVERWFTHASMYLGYVWKYAPQEALPRSVVAWDTARVVHVGRIFLDAGFVSPEEAWEFIGSAVELARPAYGSWAAYQDGFLTGRLFWQLRDQRHIGEKESEANESFERAGEDLLSRDGSPWKRLAW